jgi:hypothetical protein
MDYLQVQGRFEGLSDEDVGELQRGIDERWEH